MQYCVCGQLNRDNAQFCARCGKSLGLGQGNLLYNRYVIVRLLKRGGMGAVYLAQDTHLGNQECVVKEMLDQFVDAQQHQHAAQMFEREAVILSRLRHNHIPRVYDHFAERGRHYLVMDYVQGRSLEEVLRSEGKPIDEGWVIEWALQICDVLAYLHEQQTPIIFRDLKPANVMLQDDSQIKLIDFGIARHFAPTQSNTPFGTPMYAPPEQYRGHAEPRSDLYALGATMHHLLSGQESIPFQFPLLRTIVPNISPAAEALVASALNLQLNARPISARAFRQSLESLGGVFTMDVGFVHPILAKNDSPLVQFKVQVTSKDRTVRVPVQTHFCLLLDVSGSMHFDGNRNDVSGQKYWPLLQATQHLVSSISNQDLVSVLVFAEKGDVIFATRLADECKRQNVGGRGGLIDSSPDAQDPGGTTNLQSAFSGAMEIIRQFQRPNIVHRILVLTDGQIHDIESCRSLFDGLKASSVETYAFGLGGDWQVEPMKTMLTGCPGGSFKPISTTPNVSTYDISNSFSRFAQSSQNIIATDATLELVFHTQVKPGDAFLYSPVARLLGSNVYTANRFSLGVGSLEAGQEYSWCFEARLQPSNENLQQIGTVTLRYHYQGKSVVQSQGLGVERHLDPRRVQLKDDQIEEVFTFLEMLRSEDPQKQLRALTARLDIATRKGYDPEHLNALRNAIAILQSGGRIEDLPLKDQLWVRTDPRGITQARI